MNAEMQASISRSAQAFREVVWPAIAPMIGGGRLVQVETHSDKELRVLLDTRASVDAFQDEPGGLRAMACRVQLPRPDGEPYNSFTIRKRTARGSCMTERAKLVHALEHDYERPYWHVQAYIGEWGGSLLTAAAVRTSDLVRAMSAGVGYERAVPRTQTRFDVLEWASLIASGVDVQIVDNHTEPTAQLELL